MGSNLYKEFAQLPLLNAAKLYEGTSMAGLLKGFTLKKYLHEKPLSLCVAVEATIGMAVHSA